MHGHRPDSRIAAQDRDLVRRGEDDFACDGVAAVIVGSHRHAIAGLQPARIMRIGPSLGFGCRRMRHVERAMRPYLEATQ